MTFTKSTKEIERLISIKSLAKSSDFDPKEVDIFWLSKDLFYGKCIGGHILGEIADFYSKFVQCHIWAYQLKWSCSTRELGRYQECGGCCSAGFKVAFDKDLEAPSELLLCFVGWLWYIMGASTRYTRPTSSSSCSYQEFLWPHKHHHYYYRLNFRATGISGMSHVAHQSLGSSTDNNHRNMPHQILPIIVYCVFFLLQMDLPGQCYPP